MQLGEGLAPAPERVAVFVVVTLGAGGGATANLRAPLVLDMHARRGRQVVLPAEPRGVCEPLTLH
jgi:flagellar assembly factor FliW